MTVFLQDPLIAAIKQPKHIERFLQTTWKTVLLQTGTISVLKRYVDVLKENGRYVFVHVEKIPGISYDKEGLQFFSKIYPTARHCDDEKYTRATGKKRRALDDSTLVFSRYRCGGEWTKTSF